MPKVHEGKLDASNRRFAIVVARVNSLSPENFSMAP